eukprot:TRINITY_DN20960_c0_g3_i1.p1 TRINITY_DN20960_c0_g3~~TRINITY_DN20960_c0_g3_i1.p1  ORF type:complete len:287 (-),score=70.68 TRINITY_DN20960_c0_g3_i1:15-875(-)
MTTNESISAWARIQTHLEHHNNIGTSDLLKIPTPVWATMISPFTEPTERRNNYLALLSTSKLVRNHLMPLLEVEDPKERYLPLLEGCWMACSARCFADYFVRIEGNWVEVVRKSEGEEKEMSAGWEWRKVDKGRIFQIEMEVKDANLEEFIRLPVLVFQRYPKVPYPVKVIKGNLEKVTEREYQGMMSKAKRYKPVMCRFQSGSRYSKDIPMNSEIALGLFQQVPKDFPMRNELMFAMSEIVESTSYNLLIFNPRKKGKPSTEQDQKDEIMAAMIKRFPSLSSILH